MHFLFLFLHSPSSVIHPRELGDDLAHLLRGPEDEGVLRAALVHDVVQLGEGVAEAPEEGERAPGVRRAVVETRPRRVPPATVRREE